jgi:hypothetical protein
VKTVITAINRPIFSLESQFHHPPQLTSCTAQKDPKNKVKAIKGVLNSMI